MSLPSEGQVWDWGESAPDCWWSSLRNGAIAYQTPAAMPLSQILYPLSSAWIALKKRGGEKLVSVLVVFNLAKTTSHEDISGLLPLTAFKSYKLSYTPP